MHGIESCTLRKANFMYVVNSMWKHAPQMLESRSNLIFVTEGVLYIEMQEVQYTVRPGEFLFLPHGVLSSGYRPSGVPTGFFFAIFDTLLVVDLPAHFGFCADYVNRVFLRAEHMTIKAYMVQLRIK